MPVVISGISLFTIIMYAFVSKLRIRFVLCERIHELMLCLLLYNIGLILCAGLVH